MRTRPPGREAVDPLPFLFAQLVAIDTALLGGRTADRIGPRNAMLVALTALGVFFVPLFPVIHSGSVPLIGICTAGVIASIISPPSPRGAAGSRRRHKHLHSILPRRDAPHRAAQPCDRWLNYWSNRWSSMSGGPP